MTAIELPLRIMALVVICLITVCVITAIVIAHRDDMERIKRDGGGGHDGA